MENKSNIASNIDEHGWHCCNVFDHEGVSPDFAYSIGFEKTFDHPEIMIFGLEHETAHQILWDIANDIKDGAEFKTDEKLSNVIGGEFQVIFKEVKIESFSEYLGQAVDFYDKPFRAWVLLWPDKNHVLPIENNCLATEQNEALRII